MRKIVAAIKKAKAQIKLRTDKATNLESAVWATGGVFYLIDRLADPILALPEGPLKLSLVMAFVISIVAIKYFQMGTVIPEPETTESEIDTEQDINDVLKEGHEE